MFKVSFFKNVFSSTILSVFLISGSYASVSAYAASDKDADKAVSSVGSGTRIAVVDFIEVVEKSKVYSSIKTQIEKRRDTYSESAQKSEAALKKKYQEIEAQKNVLSEKDQKDKMAALIKEATALREKTAEEGAIIENAVQNNMVKVNEAVLKSIASEAKDKYDIVLDRAAVPYAGPNVKNITNDAIEAVNKSMSSLDVDFSAPATAPAQTDASKAKK